MHIKSGLFQLRKITTCSKGYIRLLFPSVPTAHLIHGQEYSAIENNNSKKIFRFILLKKVSKLTGMGCHQEYAKHLSCMFTLPKLLVLPRSSCVSHKLDPIFSHELHPCKSEFQSTTSLPRPQHCSLDPYFPVTCLWMRTQKCVVWVSCWGHRGENKAIPNFASVWCYMKLQNDVSVL